MAFSFVRDAVNALGCAFVVAWSVRKNVGLFGDVTMLY